LLRSLRSFCLMRRPPPRSPLFPYTTLFRSTVLPPLRSGETVLRRSTVSHVRGAIAPHDDLPALVQRPQPGRRGSRGPRDGRAKGDRKSTRLNSSHVSISYAVFCLKKKNVNT